MEQKQIWHDHIRILITTSDDKGSIQLNLYDAKQDFGGTAVIYALWVDPLFRRQKYASKLLTRAEDLAKVSGHDSVFMEWELEDTPKEILDWYLSIGYRLRKFNTDGSYALLEKALE